MPPLIIPIFIAHQGCPHCCIYCDQYSITGSGAERDSAGQTTPEQIHKHLTTWLERPRKHPDSEVQAAFYGGSFTALPTSRQEELLAAVAPFIEQGLVDLIRLSTRPDSITAATADFLFGRGVRIIELGVQSMDNDVLKASRRGHTADQVREAVQHLRGKNLSIGLQIMIGLPTDSTTRLMATAREVAALAPDFIRIYPALVIKDSALARLYETGGYRPLSLNKAIALTARLKRFFDQQGIRTIRMGLQPSTELDHKVLAGPHHPAFGELVLSRLLFKDTRSLLLTLQNSQTRQISIAAQDQSIFRGPGNINMKKLHALGLAKRMTLRTDPAQERYTVTLC